MNTVTDVVVLVGSLRQEAYSMKMAKALVAVDLPELRLDIAEIGTLPLYNASIDTDNPPEAWVAFRACMTQARAILVVTPEHSRSIPSVLRNALHVASHPSGNNRLDGKPGAVVSTSIGTLGGDDANQQLRQSLVDLNVPLMPQSQTYIGEVDTLFDAKGQPRPHCHTRAAELLHAYARWVSVVQGRS